MNCELRFARAGKPARSASVWAAALLSAGLLCARGAGQQADTPPPLPPPGPPPLAVFQHQIPSAQLAFLKDYEGKTIRELEKDKRFAAIEKQITPATNYYYHSRKTLQSAREEVLDYSPRPFPIVVRDGRFVMVASATVNPSFNTPGVGRGFLWFDIEQGIGLGGIFFHPSNGEPSPTLAVFSRQLTDTALGMSQLPLDFAIDLAQWSMATHMQAVTVRYFIPANGKKYVLIHDEDYCDHPPNAPAPDPNACAELNAEAADADMNGAYFMKETGNAADATAYMLGSDQVAWIGMRTQRCGIAVACRIQVTHERTRVLMGGGGGRRR